jgi:hypothetical protein
LSELEAYDLAVVVPSGWEGRIFRRAEDGDLRASQVAGAPGPPGERSFPVVHVASIPLPIDIADYGSDVVEDLGGSDTLVVLKEFDPAEAVTALFARVGMPRPIDPEVFDPSTLQRRLDGQAGYQVFFQESGRAFCLYVVLGDYRNRNAVVPLVNAVLSTLRIGPPTLVAP